MVEPMNTTDFTISAAVLLTIAHDDDVCAELVIPVRRAAPATVDGWVMSAEDLASADDATIARLYPTSGDAATVVGRRR